MFFFNFLHVLISCSSHIPNFEQVLYSSILCRLKFTTRHLTDTSINDICEDIRKNVPFDLDILHYGAYYDLHLIISNNQDNLILIDYFNELFVYISKECANNNSTSTEQTHHTDENATISPEDLLINVPTDYLLSFLKCKYFLQNKIKHEDLKFANLKLLMFLRLKYSSILDLKLSIPEFHNLLFYIYTIQFITDPEIIFDTLINLSITYYILINNDNIKNNINYIYYLIEKIMNNVIPLTYLMTNFQELKSAMMSADSEDIYKIRSYGIILFFESIQFNKCRKMGMPWNLISQITIKESDKSKILDKLEKLMDIFY
ncbi:uncharacterized protein VNE69_02077 [Vairimorpha necatrix]|uniref:Uncharacterized protein n=1 Tax=Vairimorpha necatrix TaxID=6039 RepID=A0AAX4J990_9MICR